MLQAGFYWNKFAIGYFVSEAPSFFLSLVVEPDVDVALVAGVVVVPVAAGVLVAGVVVEEGAVDGAFVVVVLF